MIRKREVMDEGERERERENSLSGSRQASSIIPGIRVLYSVTYDDERVARRRARREQRARAR